MKRFPHRIIVASFFLLFVAFGLPQIANAEAQSGLKLAQIGTPPKGLKENVKTDADKSEAPESAEDAELGDDKAEGEDSAEENKAEEMLERKGKVYISERVSIGTLHDEPIIEYGLQFELTAPRFGFHLHWVVFHPIDHNVNFAWDFSLAFHYYPFADGPSGLYVGPGYTLIHMDKSQRQLEKEGVTNVPSTGRQFDLMGPTLVIGYRYVFPFHLTLGFELTATYGVSDQSKYSDSKFFWTANPQVGVAF